MSYGIKETKELVKFGIALGEAVDASLSDGKLGLEDAVNFYTPITAAGDAFADISLVPKELGDLDEAEKTELLNYVKTEFDIADDKLEEAIERSLKTVFEVHGLVVFIKNMKKEEVATEEVAAEQTEA